MKVFYTLLKRGLQLVLLAFLVTSSTFMLSALIPGDFFTSLEANPSIRPETVAQLRQQFGLYEPTYLQYARWLKNFLQLDLGYSLFYGRSVTSVLADALTHTLWIGVPALLFGLFAGIFLGALHAIYKGRPFGYGLDILSTVILSLPSLILGLAALLLASLTNLFPLGGVASANLLEPTAIQWILDRVHHLALPIICLTLPIFASVEKIQYAATQDTIEELYVRSAQSRGLARSHLFFQYIVRPSLNPVISTLGPLVGVVLSVSLIVEWIFSWPGLGKVTYDALFNRDLFLLLGCVAGGSLLLILGSLASDLLLFALDPRTREPLQGAVP